jgi:5-methylthioadenosine/S-adenosylhomocysteine deaminase
VDWDDEQLVRMVTTIPASILGWEGHLGRIREGAFADVLAIQGTQGDPYENLVRAREDAVSLVVIHGIPRYGSRTLMEKVYGPGALERLDVRGKSKAWHLDVPDSPINGLSLAEAVDALSEATSDLEAVGDLMEQDEAVGFDDPSRIELVLDMQPPGEEGMEADEAAGAAPPEMAASIPLDPLFVDPAVDLDRIDRQKNLPDGLAEALRAAYG